MKKKVFHDILFLILFSSIFYIIYRNDIYYIHFDSLFLETVMALALFLCLFLLFNYLFSIKYKMTAIISFLVSILIVCGLPCYKVNFYLFKDTENYPFNNVSHYDLYRKNFPLQHYYHTFDSRDGVLLKEIEITQAKQPMLLKNVEVQEMTNSKTYNDIVVHFQESDKRTEFYFELNEFNIYGWFNDEYNLDMMMNYIIQ